MPEPGSLLRADEALQYGAVAVFADRATHADARFVLTEDNAPTVADICRQLDGIPLALELAAARVKVLSLANLAQRLNERFKILTGGSRTTLARHKTLTALIDWSYDLLTEAEQTLFKRIGIFAGGFGLEAAAAVCGGDGGLDEIDILNLLASLADKSLVVADTAGAQERYRLLESTRAYALQKLDAGERGRLARRHAEHYAQKAQQADQRYGTGSTFAWLDGVGLELDNYRSALEWCLTQGHDAMLGGAIGGALSRFWPSRGLPVEGQYWIEAALGRLSAAEHPQIFARLLTAQAFFLTGSRRCEVAVRAVEIYESGGDRHGAAWARRRLASGLYETGRLDEAMQVITQALAAMKECRDEFGIANCLDTQANVATELGAVAEARDLHAQALAMHKAAGDEISTAISLINVAELEFTDGQAYEALRTVTEALSVHERRGLDSTHVAMCNCNSAAYRIALDDLDGAGVSAQEGLRIARQLQNTLQIGTALQHLALIIAQRGKPHRAAQLLGHVNAQFTGLGYSRESTGKWGYDKLISVLGQQLSAAELERFVAEGAAWSEDQAVEEALKV